MGFWAPAVAYLEEFIVVVEEWMSCVTGVVTSWSGISCVVMNDCRQIEVSMM